MYQMMTHDMRTFLLSVMDYEVPKATPYNRETYIDTPEDRFKFPRAICTDRGMWAIVDMQWTANLAYIIGDNSVLEVMSGAGWLAKALEDHGVDILPTDDKSWYETHTTMRPLTIIDKIDAISAVDEYGPQADILLCSWDPNGSKELAKAMKYWDLNKPIIYIGEVGTGGNSSHGCTGSSDFLDRYTIVDRLNHPQWEGMHDTTHVGYFGGYNDTNIETKGRKTLRGLSEREWD